MLLFCGYCEHSLNLSLRGTPRKVFSRTAVLRVMTEYSVVTCECLIWSRLEARRGSADQCSASQTATTLTPFPRHFHAPSTNPFIRPRSLLCWVD